MCMHACIHRSIKHTYIQQMTYKTRQTDRQADRQTGRQIDRQTDRQIDMQANRQTD